MGVFERIGAPAMTKHMLCYFDSCNLVKMGCSRMAEKPGVQFFIDIELICRRTEDILQRSWGDAFFTLG